MAKYRFNLREASSKKATPINLVIRYNNKRLVFSSGESINPKYWSFKEQRAKITKKFPEHSEFNERLDSVMSIAKRVVLKYLNDNDQQYPKIDELRRLLKEQLSGTMRLSKMSLFGFIQHFIEQSRESKSHKTIQWHKLTFKRLKEFSRDYDRDVDFDMIDLDFYSDFCDFLMYELNYSTNTIGKHIQNLKAFLNEATERGINSNLSFRSKKFKKVTENTDSIYLTEEELNEMFRLDLTSAPRLERVRDLFIVGCWTGLRFGDFTNIKEENIDGQFIEIKTQKTGEKVVIPVHPMVRAILDKYKDKYANSLPPAISNAKMNAYLKEVGFLVQTLHSKVSLTRTKGGVRRTSKIEKFKLISSHTARRSMATNLYLSKFPAISIMKITGHKSESAFLKYIKITPRENAELLLRHWQDKITLKVV